VAVALRRSAGRGRITGGAYRAQVQCRRCEDLPELPAHVVDVAHLPHCLMAFFDRARCQGASQARLSLASLRISSSHFLQVTAVRSSVAMPSTSARWAASRSRGLQATMPPALRKCRSISRRPRRCGSDLFLFPSTMFSILHPSRRNESCDEKSLDIRALRAEALTSRRESRAARPDRGPCDAGTTG